MGTQPSNTGNGVSVTGKQRSLDVLPQAIMAISYNSMDSKSRERAKPGRGFSSYGHMLLPPIAWQFPFCLYFVRLYMYNALAARQVYVPYVSMHEVGIT